MSKSVSDYIVEVLIKNNIKDVFGYPGGMVTYLLDSLENKKNKISSHLCYHEQAAAFAACANAQISNNMGCAFATSGPGATNLITGICQAFFDSVPVLFITGQVNTKEAKGKLTVRQKGFQETDIVSIVNSITKYAVYIDDPDKIKYHLEKAIALARSGRPGPVLLDIPIDIFRAVIDSNHLKGYEPKTDKQFSYEESIAKILKKLADAKRPVILAGAGVNIANVRETFRKLVNKVQLPVVTSMIAVDLLPKKSKYNFGFVGSYGHRYANFIIMRSDLIISIGSRLGIRQTGADVATFAPDAQIIRLDVDANELSNSIKNNDINIECNLNNFLNELYSHIQVSQSYDKWLKVCEQYRGELSKIDNNIPNNFVKEISQLIDDDVIITTDVGQNQVWISQSFENKPEQKILFSGGHGSMGYSLPAAIGAYHASKKKVIAFCGDGGLQMNIQELQYLFREKIPVKIIVLNNYSLGMIRHFQEMYFDSKFTQTIEGKGYSVPNFCALATAYGIESIHIDSIENLKLIVPLINNNEPVLININIGTRTYVYPKLAMNKPIDDQDPLMDRALYERLKKL